MYVTIMPVCVYILNLWNYQRVKDQQKGANRKDWGRVRSASGQEGVPRKEYSTGPKAAKGSNRGKD